MSERVHCLLCDQSVINSDIAVAVGWMLVHGQNAAGREMRHCAICATCRRRLNQLASLFPLAGRRARRWSAYYSQQKQAEWSNGGAPPAPDPPRSRPRPAPPPAPPDLLQRARAKLGLGERYSARDVDRAFRRVLFAERAHPDLGGTASAFIALNELRRCAMAAAR